MNFERQQKVNVAYKGNEIGNMYADIVVENAVVVELKSVKRLDEIHVAQLMTYLRLMELKKELLINFNVRVLKEGVRRIVL